MLRVFFRLFPSSLRSRVHKVIFRATDRWLPGQYSSVKFLPFGLCLKTGPRVANNEAKALELIHKNTSVTAPRLIDFVKLGEREGSLLMTAVPGTSADTVFYRLTYEEREQLGKDLGQCVSQYRRIKNRHEHLICDTMGGPITDHRLDDIPLGPYDSETAFFDYLTEGLEDIKTQAPLSSLYEKRHDVCFTHSDLHLSNLLIEEGRLSGIVDWENAGFKPEYWEYTRALWAYQGHRRRQRDFDLAFEKNYEEELDAEKLLWRLKPVY